jgi:hypothetical protein
LAARQALKIAQQYCPVKHTMPSLTSSMGAALRPILFGADLNGERLNAVFSF